jgi:hypothetical protein
VAIWGNVVVVALTTAISGWWFWRNIALYGDWSGTQNMVEMMGPRSVAPTLEQLLAETPGLMRSFWGLFGGLSLPLPPAVYWLLNLMLLAGLAGLIVATVTGHRRKLPAALRQSWPVLAGWLVLIIIGLVQWTLRTPASQGRLLFPALPALATLWAAGWLALAPRRLSPLPAIILLVLAVWTPWGIFTPAYAYPQQVAALPPSAQTLDVTFGDAIRLLAYEGDTSTQLKPGQSLPITLYWRSKKAIEIDYSVFIQLLDENDLIIAQRDMYHGAGLYPTSQWRVGDQFADAYVLQIPRPAFAPATASFGVGLYDKNSGVRLPASTGGDMVRFGQVDLQPFDSDIPNPQDLQFEDGIALVGYTLDRRLATNGDAIKLTLYWEGRNQPASNYKVFVHLATEGDLRAAQHDSEPQNGGAPTSTWQRGQTITDDHTLTINPSAPPGVYRLKVGLYDESTGQRLRLIRDAGVSVQADSVWLSGVRVVGP